MQFVERVKQNRKRHDRFCVKNGTGNIRKWLIQKRSPITARANTTRQRLQNHVKSSE